MLHADREIEFLRLAADGKTAGEISEAMKVTERTANFHVGNAMEKLGAKNKTQAVALAMRLGHGTSTSGISGSLAG